MKVILFLLLFGFSALSVTAQYSRNDTIYPVKVNLGYKYYQSGKLLRMADLTEILATNAEADKQFRRSKGYMVGEYLFSLVGGFLVGYELGGLVGGNKIDWRIMGPSLAAVGVSIPFSILAEEKKKKAIRVFNEDLKRF